MSQTLDDLSVSYFEEGIETVKELDKVILSKGAWSTIIFRYKDWDNNAQQYGADKYTIRRYRKRDGEYKQQSKFNISSAAQAAKIVEVLNSWLANTDVANIDAEV